MFRLLCLWHGRLCSGCYVCGTEGYVQVVMFVARKAMFRLLCLNRLITLYISVL